MATVIFNKQTFSILFFLLLSSVTLAQDLGNITGVVRSNASGKSLAGVSVSLKNSNQVTATVEDGSFSLRNLAAGEYTLHFSYLGLEDSTQNINVITGETTKIDIALGLQEEEVLTIGIRGSQASALNQQRTAFNVSNVISADDAGRFPDSNPAEALQRVPGISINREEKGGEGRYVSIRGLDSGLNNFKLNGINVAQTDSDNRRVAMDVFQIDALSSIVVNKTLLPDMDGEGIGGAVELNSSSAFDIGKSLFTFTAEGNYNNFAEDTGGKLSSTYANLFGAEDEFGILLSITHDQRSTLGYNNLQDEEYIPLIESDEGEAIDLSGDNDLVPWWFGLGNFDNERENIGASMAFDWRSSEHTVLKFKGSYNKLEDTEFSSGFFIIADDDELYQDGVYNPEGGTVYQVRSEYEESVFTNSTYSFSGESQYDRLSFDYGIGYATGLFDEPNDYEVAFEYELSEPVLYDFSDPYFPQPQLSDEDTAAIRDPANFSLGGNDIDTDISKDSKITAHIDLRFEPESKLVRYWKGGLKILKSKHELFEANVLDAQGDLTLAGSVFEGGYLDTSKINSPYGDILSLNRAAVSNWRQLAGELVADGTLENDYEGELPDEDSYEADETVYASYLMAHLDHQGWEYIGGVRIEYTDFESRGYTIIEDDNGEDLQDRTSKSSDTQFFPRIQINYRASDQLVYRGALFSSTARPEFQFLNAATEIEISDDNSLEAFVGNPDLKPAYAWNLDLGVEYYLSNIGVYSANVFYKHINDFIFADGAPEGSTDSAELEALYPGYNIDVETVFNGETATVYGLEMAMVNQFVDLPSFWSGFGVYANLTLQRSEAETGLDDRNKVDFFNAPEYIGTAALTYEDYGVSINLAYTFRDAALEELGPYLIDKYQQSYDTLDLQARYQIATNWEAYLSVIDLLDDGLDPVVHKALGQDSRYPEDITFNGTTYKFGVTARF